MKRSIRATLDIWIARIGTAFGWFWFVLWILTGIVGITELFEADRMKKSLDYAMPIICFGLAAVHFLLIRASKKTRELVSDFNYYASILAKNKSVSALCQQVKKPREVVEEKLAQMCRRGYFKGRVEGDRLVLDTVHEAYAARCPGCGATTSIYKNGDVCRYCGNPLTVSSAETAGEQEVFPG